MNKCIMLQSKTKYALLFYLSENEIYSRVVEKNIKSKNLNGKMPLQLKKNEELQCR